MIIPQISLEIEHVDEIFEKLENPRAKARLKLTVKSSTGRA